MGRERGETLRNGKGEGGDTEKREGRGGEVDETLRSGMGGGGGGGGGVRGAPIAHLSNMLTKSA